jgi:hypothetical protein
MVFVPELFRVKHFNENDHSVSYFTPSYLKESVPLYIHFKQPLKSLNVSTIIYSDLKATAREFKMKAN